MQFKFERLYLKGVWSCDNGSAFSKPSGDRETEIALESPTFAMWMVSPWNKQHMAVVPLMMSSIWLWCNCSFVQVIACFNASWGEAAKRGYSPRFNGTYIINSLFIYTLRLPAYDLYNLHIIINLFLPLHQSVNLTWYIQDWILTTQDRYPQTPCMDRIKSMAGKGRSCVVLRSCKLSIMISCDLSTRGNFARSAWNVSPQCLCSTLLYSIKANPVLVHHSWIYTRCEIEFAVQELPMSSAK